jgi:formylglycine-generating enzyme required for sulfatase activity
MGLIPPNPPLTSYFSKTIISNSDMQELKTGISEKMIKPLIKWAGRTMLNVEVAPRSENKMTFDEAQMYCLFCQHNGKKNWRLPTRHEWETIYGWETPVWLVENDNVVINEMWYVQPVRDKA